MDNYLLEINNFFKKELNIEINKNDLNFIFYNGLYKLNKFWDFDLHLILKLMINYCEDLSKFNPIEILYNYLYNYIKESFKYDKLSEDLIVYHNINFKKTILYKKNKIKIEEEVIQVNMNKFIISKKIELLVKLIRYLDKNRVIKNEDSKRITTNILNETRY